MNRWGPRRRTLTGQQRKFSTDPRAYRSGLEERTAAALSERGVTFTFEALKLPFTEPAKKRTYTPDFILPNGVVVETKGLFLSEDRQKHKLVKDQHPDIDIRFVFSNAHAKIAKKSPTTYAKWAETNGFKWAHREIPEAWLLEAANGKSQAALREVAG